MANQILFPVAFFDSPQVFNSSVTNIPPITGSPIQVVSDSGNHAIFAIDYIDTTGNFIGVYTGAVGQEELKSIIGGGLSLRSFCVIPAHSRISIRSMLGAAINYGSISATFMGY